MEIQADETVTESISSSSSGGGGGGWWWWFAGGGGDGAGGDGVFVVQISQWGNIEWHHDVDKMEVRSRLAAAALFVYVNSHAARTVFNKEAANSPV